MKLAAGWMLSWPETSSSELYEAFYSLSPLLIPEIQHHPLQIAYFFPHQEIQAILFAAKTRALSLPLCPPIGSNWRQT